MLRVLHLSDLHLGILLAKQQEGGKPPSAHRFVKGTEPRPDVLANILIKDPTLREPPDLIVVSGDLVWAGDARDYTYATAFLAPLRAKWPNGVFIVAPGNHDVDWSKCAANAGAEDHSQDAYRDFAKALYETQFETIYPLLAGEKLVRENLVGFHEGTIREQSFLVVTVNSAAHQQKGNVPVHIRPSVLEAIQDRLAQRAKDELRVFVLHHHLLPFAEPSSGDVWDPTEVPDKPDPTIVANSAKLQAWLAKNGFFLVLHGHKHQSHGRVDVLLRKSDPQDGRRLVIIGAGSAGVAAHERAHGDPLSYNVITISRLASTRWQADISVREIRENEAVPEAGTHHEYSVNIGPLASPAPIVIHADRPDQCHAAIRARSMGKGILFNFTSIVDSGEYVECPTAQIGSKPATQVDVVRSFEALHPEYERSEHWRNLPAIESALRDVSPRFQFNHGPRLFGIPEAARKLDERDKFRPIMRALSNLGRENASNAYVGLFNSELDVLSSGNEPLPALVGLQFIQQNGDQLDLVATFRKLELSYWWVVNMYEAWELLEWAGKRTKKTPRRIVFFSPLAEWKENPEAAFVTQLDKAPISELLRILKKVDGGDAPSLATLREMIHEKYEHTNEKNLDPQGLERVGNIITGLHLAGDLKTTLKNVGDKISESASHIRTAMRTGSDDQGIVQKARESLRAASELLSAAL